MARPLHLALVAILLIAVTHAPSAAARPNVVLVLCDDLGYGDLACYGSPTVKTPHIDRFAASGLRLTSCYAASANCSPARAGLLTGRTPYRAGIHNWIPMLSPMHLRRGEITLSGLLKQSGYSTCHVGKWHLNGRFNYADQPQPSDHGFDHWFSTQNNALPSHRDPDNFVRNGKPVGPLEGYSSQLVVDEALTWLDKTRDKTKPFFLFVCFHEPHEPIASAEIFKRQYPDLKNPAQVRHHANITQMDHAFGRLLAGLDQHRLSDDTLVLFTSDNGPAITRYHPHGSTGPLREKKGHLYEGGIRVPGIVRWPGHIKPGTTSDVPVSGVDVLPTFCEATATPLPADRHFDGSSVLALFDTRGAKSIKRHQPLFWQFHVASSLPKVALRDGDWKLLAHLDGPRIRPFGDIRAEDQKAIKSQSIAKLELYNLKEDIGETRDRAADQPQRVKRMGAVLRRLFRQVQQESPTWPAWTWPRVESQRIAWAGKLRGYGWRTNGSGSHPEADAPTHWSPDENIAWATPLPTRSNSLPVFTRRAVFTCVEPFGLAKLDLATGKILWQRTSSYTDVTSPGDWSGILKEVRVLKQLTGQAAVLKKQRVLLEDSLEKARDKKAVVAEIEKIEAREDVLHEKIDGMPRAARYTLPITQRLYNGYTTATPITDGRLVWAVFGNRVVTCFDMEGKRKWARVLPDNPQMMWGHSASPLLVAGRLIVPIDDIVALDPETGLAPGTCLAGRRRIDRVLHRSAGRGLSAAGTPRSGRHKTASAQGVVGIEPTGRRLQFLTGHPQRPDLLRGHPGDSQRARDGDRQDGLHPQAEPRQRAGVAERLARRRPRLRQQPRREHGRLQDRPQVPGSRSQPPRRIHLDPGRPPGPNLHPHLRTPVFDRRVNRWTVPTTDQAITPLIGSPSRAARCSRPARS